MRYIYILLAAVLLLGAAACGRVAEQPEETTAESTSTTAAETTTSATAPESVTSTTAVTTGQPSFAPPAAKIFLYYQDEKYVNEDRQLPMLLSPVLLDGGYEPPEEMRRRTVSGDTKGNSVITVTPAERADKLMAQTFTVFIEDVEIISSGDTLVVPEEAGYYTVYCDMEFTNGATYRYAFTLLAYDFERELALCEDEEHIFGNDDIVSTYAGDDYNQVGYDFLDYLLDKCRSRSILSQFRIDDITYSQSTVVYYMMDGDPMEIGLSISWDIKYPYYADYRETTWLAPMYYFPVWEAGAGQREDGLFKNWGQDFFTLEPGVGWRYTGSATGRTTVFGAVYPNDHPLAAADVFEVPWEYYKNEGLNYAYDIYYFVLSEFTCLDWALFAETYGMEKTLLLFDYLDEMTDEATDFGPFGYTPEANDKWKILYVFNTPIPADETLRERYGELIRKLDALYPDMFAYSLTKIPVEKAAEIKAMAGS